MKYCGNEMMIIVAQGAYRGPRGVSWPKGRIVAQGRNEFRPWARICRIPTVPDIMILTFAHFNGQNQASI